MDYEMFDTIAKITNYHSYSRCRSFRSKWSISQLDVKNAFLNGDLQKVYIEPPPSVPHEFGYVCKKSIIWI